jgi:hypothetical protein
MAAERRSGWKAGRIDAAGPQRYPLDPVLQKLFHHGG